jgi:hypothetical protein
LEVESECIGMKAKKGQRKNSPKCKQ